MVASSSAAATPTATGRYTKALRLGSDELSALDQLSLSAGDLDFFPPELFTKIVNEACREYNQFGSSPRSHLLKIRGTCRRFQTTVDSNFSLLISQMRFVDRHRNELTLLLDSLEIPLKDIFTDNKPAEIVERLIRQDKYQMLKEFLSSIDELEFFNFEFIK